MRRKHVDGTKQLVKFPNDIEGIFTSTEAGGKEVQVYDVPKSMI